jgi:hypothetical protein
MPSQGCARRSPVSLRAGHAHVDCWRNPSSSRRTYLHREHDPTEGPSLPMRSARRTGVPPVEASLEPARLHHRLTCTAERTSRVPASTHRWPVPSSAAHARPTSHLFCWIPLPERSLQNAACADISIIRSNEHNDSARYGDPQRIRSSLTTRLRATWPTQRFRSTTLSSSSWLSAAQSASAPIVFSAAMLS